MRTYVSIVVCLLALASSLPVSAQDHAGYHNHPDSVVAIVNAGSGLSVVSSALIETRLDSLLQDREFTIFVPSDEAWDNLSADVRERLFEADNMDQLEEVLRYHIIVDRSLTSKDLLAIARAPSGSTITNLYGRDVPLSDAVHGLLIDEANVIEPDLESGDGIVHVIDAVLLPPGMRSAGIAK